MDVEFWFAAPSNDQGDTYNRDRPIQLIITTYNEPAHVTISQPAGNAFFIETDISANNYEIIDLTAWIDQIEVPSNVVSNNGILIESDEIISVYYEQNSTMNPDIYSLKGRNSLGTDFLIPSQMWYENEDYIVTTPIDCKNSFDIVATEDNTEIEINPKKNIEGHSADKIFNIVLNRGQTFECRAVSQLGENHLAGSTVKVTNNKPIAISVSDDAVEPSGGSPDLVADQIIPIDILGYEYIVLRGYLWQNTDLVCIMATKDNTVIDVISETTNWEITLENAGETTTLPFGSKEYYYIKSRDPEKSLSVFQFSGFAPQPSGAIIPPIRECAGSSKVIYSRSTTEAEPVNKLGLQIIVDAAGKDFMRVKNGNNTIPNALDGSLFAPVVGTENQWYYYRGEYIGEGNSTIFPPENAYTFENDNGIFHIGILNGRAEMDGSCRFGYFSNFSSLNIGTKKTKCPDSAIWIDADVGFLNYEWHHLSNPDEIIGTQESIQITNPDIYWVTVSNTNCELTDSITISDYEVSQVNIGPDQENCEGTAITLDAYNSDFIYYRWSNGIEGENASEITTNQGGQYSVEVTNQNGCFSVDTTNLIIGTKPVAQPIRHN